MAARVQEVSGAATTVTSVKDLGDEAIVFSQAIWQQGAEQ